MRNLKRKIRAKRGRLKIKGTALRPRLCVFRSNLHFYAQAIDDIEGRTLASMSDFGFKKSSAKERAQKVGEGIAKNCLAKKINEVVFDRSGSKYAGTIKIIAEAARKKGLKF